jgi:pyridoxamine 5'-phosphate oxidase
MSATILETKKPTALTPLELQQAVLEYIKQTRWATLTTVREDGAPVSRTIGGFAPDGLNIFFSTSKKSGKNRHIARNKLVSFHFQHENQELAAFKNLVVIGQIEAVSIYADYQRAVDLLSVRSPRFKARIELGETEDLALYLVRAKEIKYLNFANGVGPAAVQEIIL